MTDIARFEAEFAEALAVVSQDITSNLLMIDDVRDGLRDYLRAYAEDLSHFPEIAGDDHWDLVMADHNPEEDGVFAVALFTKSDLAIVLGSHPAPDVRRFAESEFPESPGAILEATRLRFRRTSPVLRIPLAKGLYWIEAS